MKVKLLKKFRKRFKIVHNQESKSTYDKIYKRKAALVYDLKEGVEPELMSYVNALCLDNGYHKVCSASLAEYLAIIIIGVTFVYRHRQLIEKRKKRAFRLNYQKNNRLFVY